MEQTSEDTNTPVAGAENEPAAPRRRASRRVTAAAGEAVATPVVVESPAAEASTEAPAASEGADADADATPKKRVSRARKKAESVAPEGEAPEAPAVETPAIEAPEIETPAPEGEAAEAPAKKAPARRKRQTAAEKAEAAAAEAAADASNADPASDAPAETANETAEKTEAAQEQSAPKKRGTRSRGKKAAENGQNAQNEGGEQGGDTEAKTGEKSDEQVEKSEGGSAGNGRQNGGNGGSDGQTRSSRTRQRERKRRGGGDEEPEITEDDVLLPIAGILDVLENYAFVRTSGYLPGTGDVYVSLGQVKKYGLRKGDAVVGAIRQPREGEGSGRQKYNAIVKVDTVNSKPVDEEQNRPDFADFTPVHPDERLRLETDSGELGARVIDLFAPIGKGQRGLIVGPHESGKSTALQQVARAVAENQPDAHLMLVLIDERPEEVTELTRTINGEVIASTFDRPAEDHTTIAELAVERAKRLVELGHDVVVLIDSLTSLARAYNLAAPASVRVPSGSLDAASVFPIKRLLSAARNIENGGSLTIVATASAQPESRLDEALLGELEGIANMQLRLSGEAADRRVFPAIDLARSSTRNEALLTSEAEARLMNGLRRAQQGQSALESLEDVLRRIAGTSSNVEFLAVTQRAQA